MRAHEVESWALSIIERVQSGHPTEDSRVELKSSWIPPEKAARRIAGHANAARGEHILWLIGVDEKSGVVGAGYEELADWYQAVTSQFDGLAPQLSHYNIPVDGKTVAALLFETNGAPFVVKNSAHGKAGGGPVSLEVPWREGTGTRSAHRAELLKLLSPLQAVPSFEVRGAKLTARRGSSPESTDASSPGIQWSLRLRLYAETTSEDLVVIPFHRCRAEFQVPGTIELTKFASVRLSPPVTGSPGAGRKVLSETIRGTRSEVLIAGAGELIATASGPTRGVRESFGDDADIFVYVLPVKADHAVALSARLHSCPHAERELHCWAFGDTYAL